MRRIFLEVSVIGPGRGECVVLHLGDNKWCIVDSCTSRDSSEAVAIEYLASFKTQALQRVELVVATHWHDDHVRGLASLIQAAPSANFCCSMALRSNIFATLVSAELEGIQRDTGVKEFAAILGVSAKPVSPHWAIQDRVLLDDLSGQNHPFPTRIESLSPSDTTVTAALQGLSKYLPKAGETQRRIAPPPGPNDISVVLWVTAGDLRVLLGADLEHTNRHTDGWIAVLNSHRDPKRAALIKVPHHGSKNADHPDVWNQMLEKDPIAVVTPFVGGNVRLPERSDLTRLASRTTRLYCTSSGSGKEPSRDSLVNKIMKEQLKGRQVLEGKAGHVRLRWRLDGGIASAPTFETFSGAYKVPATPSSF